MAVGLGSDVRLSARLEDVFQDIVRSGSLVVRKFSASRAAGTGAHRLLDSPKATPDGILADFAARTALACKGRRVVAAQDATEINFSGAGRACKGPGLAGDGKSLGFLVHPDVGDEAVRCWASGMSAKPFV